MFCDFVSGPGPDFSSLLCGLRAGFLGSLELWWRTERNDTSFLSQAEPSGVCVRLKKSLMLMLWGWLWVCSMLWITDVILHASLFLSDTHTHRSVFNCTLLSAPCDCILYLKIKMYAQLCMCLRAWKLCGAWKLCEIGYSVHLCVQVCYFLRRKWVNKIDLLASWEVILLGTKCYGLNQFKWLFIESAYN